MRHTFSEKFVLIVGIVANVDVHYLYNACFPCLIQIQETTMQELSVNMYLLNLVLGVYVFRDCMITYMYYLVIYDENKSHMTKHCCYCFCRRCFC